MPDPTPTSRRGSARCRFGLHHWMVIPRSILAAAQKAGLSYPHWYVGPRVPPYCRRCGKQQHPGRHKTLADLVREIER